MTELLNTAMYI